MNVRDELDRLKFHLKLKTDEELAIALNTTKVAMTQWIARKAIPEKWKRIIELQFGNPSINNSIVVNSSSINGNVINQVPTQVTPEFMEFVEKFKKYGNSELLKKYNDDLEKIKSLIEQS